MAESAYTEDWSLQAIVGGSSGDFSKIFDFEMDGHDSFLDISCNYQPLDHEFLANFPEIFETSNDELEDLYKPFYPSDQSLALKDTVVVDFQERKPENKIEDHEHTLDPSDHSSGPSSVTRVNPAYTPKYKRRKNQHKRVIIQVSAEGLGSDMWAWRKYGQKPIKGSPYPRSYYRCSSSKGCLARKQVEQSCTDPGMFIVTYTAEHSHTQPTRRNSLAGTVRQKFPSAAPKSPNAAIPRRAKHEKMEELSATYSKTLNLQEVEFPKKERVKQETKMENETRVTSTRENPDQVFNDFGMSDSDMTFGDDFFSGLEEFDAFVSDPRMFHVSDQQFPVLRSCS